MVVDEDVVTHSCLSGKEYTHICMLYTHFTFIESWMAVPVSRCTTFNLLVIYLLCYQAMKKDGEIKWSGDKKKRRRRDLRERVREM